MLCVACYVVYFLAAMLFPLIEANLATFALYFKVIFMYGLTMDLPLVPLASATAFKTSLFAYTINAVGKWTNKGPFRSGSEAEMSTLLKYL